jgi:hypothetical protein
MAFYVGQKVVCINAGPSRFTGEATNARKGVVYTVAWVGSWRSHPVLLLDEIDPAHGHDGFDAARFRPVVERKTDIGIFTAMLNPSDERVEA